MNTRVLPYGNHYGIAEEILGQVPSDQFSPGMDMYGLPPVGSPESEQLAQMMAGPASTVQLAPEEMEALKWQNWAMQQRFESLGPQAQREMARLYHDNVLPYVAGSMGADPSALQQEFMVNYPEVGAILGREPSEVEQRAQEVQQYGEDLTPEQRQSIIFTGRLPTSSQTSPGAKLTGEWQARQGIVEQMRESGGLSGVSDEALDNFILTGDTDYLSARGKATAVDEMNERLQQIDMMGGEERFTPDQIAAYAITGNASMLSPANTVKAREEVERAATADQRLISATEIVLGEVDAALNNVRRAFEILEVEFPDGEEGGPVVPERGLIAGLPIVGEGPSGLPRSGPLATMISEMPIVSQMTGDQAAQLRGVVNSIQASAAFASLKRLREASQDGSSGLGQVTEREIGLLIDEMEPLQTQYMTDQAIAESIDNFRLRMEKIRRLALADLEAAQARQSAASAALTDDQGAAPAAPAAPAPAEPAPTAPAPSNVIELTPEEAAAIFGDLQ